MKLSQKAFLCMRAPMLGTIITMGPDRIQREGYRAAPISLRRVKLI